MVQAAPVAPRKVKAKPVREKGYQAEVYDNGFGFFDQTHETIPELFWPNSVATFDRMRKDAQVKSTLNAVTSPILRASWSVDPQGCRPEVALYVARNLGLPILDAGPDDHEAPLRGRDRFSWRDHLRDGLTCLPFGHAYFEQVYRLNDAGDEYGLRKLGFRPQRTISRIMVARDGGLLGIEQFGSILGVTTGPIGPTVLPVNRLVAYVLEREGANWLGQSLLRPAYPHWYLKGQGLPKWLTAVDRFAVGIPIYTDAPGGNPDTMDAGEALATEARGGDNAGGAIPNGAEFEIKGVTGSTVDIDQFIRYQDEMIARSALGHFLNLGTQKGGQVGSYNLGSVLSDTFHMGLEAVGDLMADTATYHVVEDLVDVQYGPTEPAPKIVHGEIGVRQSELDRIREMTGLESDADLVKFLRGNANPTPTSA